MTPYEITEHTADLGIRATGATFEDLLASAGDGLFAVIAPGYTGSGPGTKTRFSLEADSRESLFHEWLDRLNVEHQLQGVVFDQFNITLQDTALKATAQAHPFDPNHHEQGVEVKAVTWHDLYVRSTDTGYEGFALLDI